jgi:hypothetical protein
MKGNLLNSLQKIKKSQSQLREFGNQLFSPVNVFDFQKFPDSKENLLGIKEMQNL